MPARRYEFRVAGRLSERAQCAFTDMAVHDAPPETIISGDVVDDAHLHGVLALIQNLGLHVVSVNETPHVPSQGDRLSERRTRQPSAPGDPEQSDG
ncbi:MAG TPA: hypothetical protein VGE11_11385 [Pseudonocardia sp.]